MLYESRLRLATQLLNEAAKEKQDLILFGSGVWFDALDRALVRELAYHLDKVSVSQTNPLVRVSFENGGSLQCVNLETGQNLHVVSGSKNRVPSKAYLVEDAHGVNAKAWKTHVRPFLKLGNCTVVYLGNAQDAESN